MITVETFEPGGKNPAVVRASRVLLADRHGNPLAVAVCHGEGGYLVAHLGDPDFEVLLATLGVRAAAVRTWVDTTG